MLFDKIQFVSGCIYAYLFRLLFFLRHMILTKILKTNLNWNAARVILLTNMIIALLKTRTVCLTDIATALSSEAKTEFKYKTLQKFF